MSLFCSFPTLGLGVVHKGCTLKKEPFSYPHVRIWSPPFGLHLALYTSLWSDSVIAGALKICCSLISYHRGILPLPRVGWYVDHVINRAHSFPRNFEPSRGIWVLPSWAVEFTTEFVFFRGIRLFSSDFDVFQSNNWENDLDADWWLINEQRRILKFITCIWLADSSFSQAAEFHWCYCGEPRNFSCCRGEPRNLRNSPRKTVGPSN